MTATYYVWITIFKLQSRAFTDYIKMVPASYVELRSAIDTGRIQTKLSKLCMYILPVVNLQEF